MEQQKVTEMSRYQVLHELCVKAGWSYEGPIQYDDQDMPRGSGYRHPAGDRSLITFDGEVYLRDRTRVNVWHKLGWVNRKTLTELRKELAALENE